MAVALNVNKSLVLGWLLVTSQVAWSQTGPESETPPVPDEDYSQETEVSGELPAKEEVPKTVERKSFTMNERKRICTRYNGGYIAYYGEVFKVEKCIRRPIVNSKTVYKILSQGVKPRNVDGDVIAALRLGPPLDYAENAQDARDCSTLEGKYVTFSSVNVYFISDCKRRMLPDWTTYLDHRTKRGDRYGAIMSLSWLEFSRVPEGEPITSVTDKAFKDWVNTEGASTDVIPIDEACAPINGQYVFYYSNLYKIERCRKRLIEPQGFFRVPANTEREIAEMTSEQWLSIPDGLPIIEGAKKSGDSTQPTSVYQH